MFKELLAIFVQFQVPSQLEQVSSLIFSRLEAEALCKNGIVGLEGIWDLYDMWI
jgi:hypothetical protein